MTFSPYSFLMVFMDAEKLYSNDMSLYRVVIGQGDVVTFDNVSLL